MQSEIQIHCHYTPSMDIQYAIVAVSDQNARDKIPMYEIPLIFVFGGWGFGVGESIFCTWVLGVGVLS